MKKFSAAWKEDMTAKHGGWAQKHESDCHETTWRWHYIQYDAEYVKPQAYRLMRECKAAHGC